MTPKEKAKYLLDKSMPLAHDWESDNKVIALKIALLCVDEILNDNPNIYDSDRLNHKYWESVKHEISLL